MENYKILYLGDNRAQYKSGNYYVDWIEALENIGEVTFYGPGYDTNLQSFENKSFNLIVYSHQFFDTYSLKRLKFLELNILRYRKIPSLIFTKNEYKKMKRRVLLNWVIPRSVLVVYSKQSFLKYKKISRKIYWTPFAAGKRFSISNFLERKIDVGYRGNDHRDYIRQRRSNFVLDVNQTLANFNLDIKISKNGEDFLFGQDYIDWLNSLKFLVNTSSAMDIVNPKFAEAMACGAITIAPEDDYEGLLVKDQHYITLNRAYELLTNPSKFDSFYTFYLENSKEYLEKYNYENQLKILIQKYL